MTRATALFLTGKSSVTLAADGLKIMAADSGQHDPAKLRVVLLDLRKANSALLTLQNELAGNPQPKKGE